MPSFGQTNAVDAHLVKACEKAFSYGTEPARAKGKGKDGGRNRRFRGDTRQFIKGTAAKIWILSWLKDDDATSQWRLARAKIACRQGPEEAPRRVDESKPSKGFGPS